MAAETRTASARSALRNFPSGEGDLLGEDDLDGVARAQGGDDVNLRPAEFGLVLPRQHGYACCHAVFDCV